MEIGEPLRTIHIEPIVNPVPPKRTPAPAPERAPVPDREKVPA